MSHLTTGYVRWKRMPLLAFALLPVASPAVEPVPGQPGGQVNEPATPVYVNDPFGEVLDGSRDALSAAIRGGIPIGVSWQTWHGDVSGRCSEATETPDGKIQCVVEVWCNEAAGDVPAKHGHKTHLDTTGNTSSMILVVRKATGERSIVAAEQRPSTVSWFRIDGQTGGTAPALASAR